MKKTVYTSLITFLFLLSFSACTPRYTIIVEPPEAREELEAAIKNGTSPLVLNGTPALPGELRFKAKELTVSLELPGWEPYTQRIGAKSLFSSTPIEIQLKRLCYLLTVSVMNGPSQILVDGNVLEGLGLGGGTAELEHGEHTLSLRREGFAEQTLSFTHSRPRVLKLIHQKEKGPAISIGIFPSGRQPKQVVFSPDSRYLIIPLLDDSGFDVIDIEQDGATTRIQAPDAKYKGYVEPLILSDSGTFMISQMTTARIHEYSLPNPTTETSLQLIRSLPAHGEWTKVLASDAQGRWIALSNWLSNDVVILDRQTGTLLRKLTNLAIPRGLVFSPDAEFLYIASFEGHRIYSFSTETWKQGASYYHPPAAFRHICLSPDGKDLYASDMRESRIYHLDAATLTEKRVWNLKDENANTIDLSPDGAYLFASCRGPNNPNSYLLRSPVDGHVYIYKTANGELVQTIEGGRQPTGLDVSPNGRFLSFTNFQDNTVEVYQLDFDQP